MSDKTAAMTPNAWPLFMNSRAPVAGNGFWAGVTVKGRGLLVLEDDGDGPEYHLYGVNPSGLCARGPSAEEAHKDFLGMLRAVMYDVAEEAPDFGSFKGRLEALVRETNGFYEERWQEALNLVRSQAIDLPGAAREPGESPPFVEVVRISEPKPADNPECSPLMIAAA